MTEYGVTELGFVAKPFSVIQAEVQTDARSAFGSDELDTITPEGFLSSVYQPINTNIAALWELLAIIYNAVDPRRSTGQSYEAVAALRGATRKFAQVGKHDDPGVTMSFDGAVAGSIARGTVRFSPEGSPSNVWINSEDFSIGGAGDFVIPAESELPGADKTLAEGATISVIEGPSALTLVVIPAGAVGGTDIEPEVTWRTRSEAIISEDQTPVGEAVEEIENVSTARVVETPGHIRVIVNDLASPASDEEIAQAIQDSKCAGVVPLGSESGQAVDANGEALAVPFDRAILVPSTATATVTSINGFSTAAVKTALQGAAPSLAGRGAIWSALFAAIKDVEGVDDLQLVIAKSPGTEAIQNLPATDDELIDFADGAITVTTA